MPTSSNSEISYIENDSLRSRYPWLAEPALRVVEETTSVRLEFMEEDRWVGYPVANALLDRMTEMKSSPRVTRPDCLLLTGATNNGKTFILKRFLHLNRPYIRPDGSVEHPVLMIQAPSKVDEKRFYAKILRKLGAVGSTAPSADALEHSVETNLRRSGTRILLIDEFQHFTAGSTNRHVENLQAIKCLTNELSLPIVGAGLPGARHSLHFDPQLENRFIQVSLPLLKSSPEFAILVMKFVATLPLRMEMPVAERIPVCKRLAVLCEGKIGEMHRLLREMAKIAIRSGDDLITFDRLKAVENLSPLLRMTRVKNV
ncbi:MAG: TniB family NTP-binding protein [Deltaproteobacteria bacterium]